MSTKKHKDSNKNIDISAQAMVPLGQTALEEYEAQYLKRAQEKADRAHQREHALTQLWTQQIGVPIKLGHTIESVAIGKETPMVLGLFAGPGPHDEDWDRQTWRLVDVSRPHVLLQIFGFYAANHFFKNCDLGASVGIVYDGMDDIGKLPNGQPKSVKRVLIYEVEVPQCESLIEAKRTLERVTRSDETIIDVDLEP